MDIMGKKKEIPVLTLDSQGVIALKNEIALKEEELFKLKQRNRSMYSQTDSDNWNAPKFSDGAAETILCYEINKLKNILDKAIIVENDSIKMDNLVELNDVIEVNLVYGENDEERMILRLGTVHQAKPEDGIEIISIESELGKVLHKSEVGSSVRFGNNDAYRADILGKINEKENKAAVEKVKK